MFNKQGEKEINKIYGLTNFFNMLEKSNGGNGNGMAYIKDGKITLRKGMSLTCKDIAGDIMQADYDWAIFHTRIASIGSLEYKNCHPFKIGDKLIAMNGTERDVGFLARQLGITDTETVLQLAHKFKFDISDYVQEFGSVFVGFEQGVPFVSAQGKWGNNLAYYKNGDAEVFASEFPFGELKTRSISPQRPFFWQEGSKVVAQKKAKYPDYVNAFNSKTKKNKSASTGWYEQYQMSVIERNQAKFEAEQDEKVDFSKLDYADWNLEV